MIVSRILDVCDADAFVSSFNHNEKICIVADCEPQCTEAPWTSVVVCRPCKELGGVRSFGEEFLVLG